LNPLPVTGRNGKTPLGVQSHFGSPTKHGYYDGHGIGSGRAIPALFHLLPLFSTLYQYSRSAHQRQQIGPIVLLYRDLEAFPWRYSGELWRYLGTKNQRVR
jgi:hypothetical protein